MHTCTHTRTHLAIKIISIPKILVQYACSLILFNPNNIWSYIIHINSILSHLAIGVHVCMQDLEIRMSHYETYITLSLFIIHKKKQAFFQINPNYQCNNIKCDS
jgi:hypothetical protein